MRTEEMAEGLEAWMRNEAHRRGLTRLGPSEKKAFAEGFAAARSYAHFLQEHGNRPAWDRALKTAWRLFEKRTAK
jgi:hypothetical protein